MDRAVIRRHCGPGHEASEFHGEGLHGVVDLRRRHRDPLHPRQVVPVVARQQGRRDLGLLPEVAAAVAVVVVELGVVVDVEHGGRAQVDALPLLGRELGGEDRVLVPPLDSIPDVGRVPKARG